MDGGRQTTTPPTATSDIPQLCEAISTQVIHEHSVLELLAKQLPQDATDPVQGEIYAILARLTTLRDALNNLQQEWTKISHQYIAPGIWHAQQQGWERQLQSKDQEIQAAKHLLDEAGNEQHRMQERLTHLQNQLDMMKTDMDANAAKRKRLMLEVDTLRRKNRRLNGEQLLVPAPHWDHILATLLPQLQLVGPSLDILQEHITDPRDLLKVLYLIHHQRQQLAGQRINQAKAWRELHFRTGQNDDGRVYYTDPGHDGKIQIFLGRKKTQELDIAYLEALR